MRPIFARLFRRLALGLVLCATAALSQIAADPLAGIRALLDSGHVQDAENSVRAYISAHPSSADAHFLLGYALFRQQKPTESLAEFTEGAKYRKPHVEELKIVAADYVMLHDYSDADTWFSQVVAETPNDADSWYLLGRTKYSESEFEAAIASFDRALNLRPRYVEAENNIGLCWKELNATEKAQAAFQTAIEWQGEKPSDAQPFLNLGTLLAGRAKQEEALPWLAKAVSLSPGNPTAHEELGKALLSLNRLGEAQAQLEQAVALAPNASELHYKLGQVLRREGLADRAQQEFAICEKLNGSHSSSKTPNPPSTSNAGP